MADCFPFGVYDTQKCQMAHIGIYENEAECWRVYLGWPSDEEIDDAKVRGLRVLPLAIKYEPPR